MSKEVLSEYCSLLKGDKQACMPLFADDAQLITHGGSKSLCLRGKEEILDYFVFIPPDLTFTITSFEEKQDHSFAHIEITGINLPKVNKIWKVVFEGSLIKVLEVLP